MIRKLSNLKVCIQHWSTLLGFFFPRFYNKILLPNINAEDSSGLHVIMFTTKAISSAMSFICRELPGPALVEEGVSTAVCGQVNACLLIHVFLDRRPEIIPAHPNISCYQGNSDPSPKVATDLNNFKSKLRWMSGSEPPLCSTLAFRSGPEPANRAQSWFQSLAFLALNYPNTCTKGTRIFSCYSLLHSQVGIEYSRSFFLLSHRKAELASPTSSNVKRINK